MGALSEAMAGGMIRLDVPKLADLKNQLESPKVLIAGLNWNLNVRSECSERTVNVKMLSVYMYCNSESMDTNWSCDCSITFTLLAQNGNKPYSLALSRTFTCNENNRGFPSFMNWEDVLNPEKGFIREDGGIVIEAAVTVKNVGRVQAPMAGGMIRLDVPKLAELKNQFESPKVLIAGLNWQLAVRSECSERTVNVKMLSVYMYCNSESKDTNWGCYCIITFTLLAQKGNKSYSRTFWNSFTFKENSITNSSFINWDDVLNPEKSFIREDGGIVIEAAVTVRNVIGIQSTPIYDFTAPQPNITDVVLLIGDKRIHVGKQFLSAFSPIFYSMFYNDFLEKDKKEIRLEELVFDEFLELLHVIYPTRKPVTAETVECLLRLGDRFLMEVVLRECTQFLCGPESNGISLEKKLLYADKYRLLRVRFGTELRFSFIRSSQADSTRAMDGRVIRLDVPMLAELKELVESPRIWIANLPWHMSVKSESSARTGNVKALYVFIHYNSDSKCSNWRCDSAITLTLLAQKANHKPYSKTFSRTFTSNEDNQGISFMNWDDVLNPEKGFIREDGGIVIEASITVKEVIGVQSTPLNDFTAPKLNITDVVLFVGDKQLHVGKQILSTFSPIFYEKFYKDPELMDKVEIKLDNVVFDEFVELLHVIYPTRKPVTDETVECLLRLGDRFKMEVVMRECIQFLCGPESNGIPFEKKLLYSDKYDLERVQFLCLESLKTLEEVRALKGKSEYGEFSSEMKAALLERIFQVKC